jgi:hypothetical protein
MDYKQIDFSTILGKTDKNGHWLDVESSEKNQNKDEEPQSTVINENNMYLFEGVDYREVPQKDDIDLFDRLILKNENASAKLSNSSNQRISERPQRRQMTEEEKAERAKKIRETKARRQQEMVSNRIF